MTKIMIVPQEANGVQSDVFADESGMIIGSITLGCTQFGPEVDKVEVRHFISRGYALAYMKMKCRTYYGREDIDFVHESPDPQLQIVSSVPPKGQRRM